MGRPMTFLRLRALQNREAVSLSRNWPLPWSRSRATEATRSTGVGSLAQSFRQAVEAAAFSRSTIFHAIASRSRRRCIAGIMGSTSAQLRRRVRAA